jgi:hypothetical protein
MRELVVLPPEYKGMPVEEVLDWATNEVLRLDEENQRLKAQVERLSARKKAA